MTIPQALAMPRKRSAGARRFLEAFMAKQSASGFIEEALKRHGIEGATVLPPR